MNLLTKLRKSFRNSSKHSSKNRNSSKKRNSQKKYSLKGGSDYRAWHHSKSRYARSGKFSKSSLSSKSASEKSRKSTAQSSIHFSKKKLDNLIEQTKSLHSLVSGLDDTIYRANNISKAHLTNSWKQVSRLYNKKQYLKASRYLLLTILIGSIILDRKKALKTSMASNVTLQSSNKRAHSLMCGILDRSSRDSTRDYKASAANRAEQVERLKKLYDFLTGKETFVKKVTKTKISKKTQLKQKIEYHTLTDKSAEKAYNFIHACRNPLFKELVTVHTQLMNKSG